MSTLQLTQEESATQSATTSDLSDASLTNVTLLDLISLEELQQIQDVYAEAIGIATIITDVDGYPITQPSNFSKVCNLVRATVKGAENCMYSSKVLGVKAHRLRVPTYQKCLSCGFIDASAPIIVADKHIANWIIGQINPNEVDVKHARAYARKIGADPNEMAKALCEPRFMALPRFEQILRLLWLLAQKISTLAYNNLRLSYDNLKLHETQAHLIQQEKLASLGSLVAGIAHEINTPVGTGVTAASYLEQETKAMGKLFNNGSLKKSELNNYLTAATDAVGIILLNLRRASELISSFKKVAVDRTSEAQQYFNLKNYIGAVILSLRPQLKKANHNIIVNCDEYIDLNSYPGDFSHIITNLIINSLVHAYPPGIQGTITIDVRHQNQELTLIYSDNGIGILPIHQPKIFEPFFTTRRGQGGTGLGLNIIYNIVTQKLKGSIACHSKPGKGTTFTITIPTENGGN